MSDRFWYLSQNAGDAKTSEEGAVEALGEGAGFWAVEMDALPVDYGEWFEPSEGLLPPELQQFLYNNDDTGALFWAVKVTLPAGTKPFNPAYLVLDSTSFQLSPQLPTSNNRYLACLTVTSEA